MNPCPCGFHNDRSRDCRCTPPLIQRYISKISGPLLDRIDIHIDVPAVNYKEMRTGAEYESSGRIRDRVICARHIQLQRFAKEMIFRNAQMAPRQMRAFCDLSSDCERPLERAMLQQGLSARAHDRILKVARTIADLDAADHLETKHIAKPSNTAPSTAPTGRRSLHDTCRGRRLACPAEQRSAEAFLS